MSNFLSSPQFQVLNTNGDPVVGAKAYFYLTGTTTATDTYQEESLTTAHVNPVIADSTGTFAAIYTNPDIAYKIVLKDADDVTIRTIDPVNSGDPSSIAYFGGFPGASAAVNEAAFQAAVDTITNGESGTIIVAQGTYAGDMEANVNIGLRNIAWWHMGPVIYTTSSPYGVQMGVDAASATAGSWGFSVKQTDVSWLNKPTLSLERITTHTSGIAGSAEPGPLYISHQIDSAVENYETAVYVVIDGNTALTTAESFTAGRFQARKYV
ncbi:MAG: hypothetical protein GY942_27060, partial [Aestuariibacter sp.]|nr:hypothetical protein [Aestuariibacter sp.]